MHTCYTNMKKVASWPYNIWNFNFNPQLKIIPNCWSLVSFLFPLFKFTYAPNYIYQLCNIWFLNQHFGFVIPLIFGNFSNLNPLWEYFVFYHVCLLVLLINILLFPSPIMRSHQIFTISTVQAWCGTWGTDKSK